MEISKTESFNDKDARNARFAELKAQDTPGLIRWSDYVNDLQHQPKCQWYLAYAVETEPQAEEEVVVETS